MELVFDPVYPVAAATLALGAAPHCAFMCGPIAANTCRSRRDARHFAVGRAVVAMGLGAMAGAVGSEAWLSAPGRVVGLIATALVAISMVATALRLARRVPLVKLRRTRSSALPAWAAGCATSLLPCGVLLSALMVSAASRTALTGSVTMGVFAITSACSALAGSVVLRLLGARARVALIVALCVSALVISSRAIAAFQAPLPCGAA